MSRWHVTFSAADPYRSGELWEVGVSRRKYDILVQHGHEARLARLQLFKEVLEDPITIYEGWSRPEKEDSFVYVGKPTRSYVKPGIEVPAPKGQFFLVFVLPDGTVDEWNWRKCDDENPDAPYGVKGKQVWPK